MKRNNKSIISRGFTLVELLIVVIILAILAAIVVPQFSSSTSDAKYSALDANLATLRTSIELYYQQHGTYPSFTASSGGTSLPVGGTAGAGAINTPAAVLEQLTMYTNATGQTSTVADATYKYGPYLKKGIPAEPFSASSVVEVSTTGALGMTATAAANTGWKFDNKTGQLIANTTTLQTR